MQYTCYNWFRGIYNIHGTTGVVEIYNIHVTTGLVEIQVPGLVEIYNIMLQLV